MQRIKKADIARLLGKRSAQTHKGDYGRLLLVCGSRGYTGAAALSAMGALRSGAGLVYLAVPESVYPILAGKLLEPVVLPVADCDGTVSEKAWQQLEQLLPRMDAVLIGPGLGISPGSLAITEKILRHSPCPVVLDADGINVICPHKHILRERSFPTVLTPHEGEFLRLGGQLTGDRCADSARLAEQTGCTVVLKGHKTVITDGNTCYINHTGNPGMAVGGSGDVLAGILISLLGQGLPPLQAAACAAWLHGAAGDLCARRIGQYGMLPQDMLEALPRLLP